MFGQVVAKVIVLSTVFLWTIQPAIFGTSVAVEACDTCSIELDSDVELAQLDVICLLTRTANVGVHSFSAALPADDAALAYESQVGSHQHLRGPPVVSFS